MLSVKTFESLGMEIYALRQISCDKIKGTRIQCSSEYRRAVCFQYIVRIRYIHIRLGPSIHLIQLMKYVCRLHEVERKLFNLPATSTTP